MNTLKNTAGKAEQAPVDAPLAANLDEAGLAALQAAIAERKARNKDRTRIILGMFAAAAITIAVWNIVALAILFPVLVVALIVAGKFWAGWTGGDEDECFMQDFAWEEDIGPYFNSFDGAFDMTRR